jgi:uncharacterized BrkB/YihY/UPF0761 family membrane protein
VLIVLVWFYALAVVVLAGAIVNALRFEIHETGEVTLGDEPQPAAERGY